MVDISTKFLWWIQSTQDTMIALQALTEYAIKRKNRGKTNMNIEVSDNVESFYFPVTDDKKFELQTLELPEGPKGHTVNVQVSGKGCALTQFISRYNVKTSSNKSFDLKVSPTFNNGVRVCAAYTGSKRKTNMVVIEVELPSGYKPKEGVLDELKKDMVKLVEYNEKSNSVAMYFNEMPKTEICTDFQLEEVLQVSSRQPSIAKIYDYYNQTDMVSVEYPF